MAQLCIQETTVGFTHSETHWTINSKIYRPFTESMEVPQYLPKILLLAIAKKHGIQLAATSLSYDDAAEHCRNPVEIRCWSSADLNAEVFQEVEKDVAKLMETLEKLQSTGEYVSESFKVDGTRCKEGAKGAVGFDELPDELQLELILQSSPNVPEPKKKAAKKSKR